MWELYQRYGDPLYPMLGAHSPSPLAAPFATHDPRWTPRALWQVLGYPFAWTLDWGLVSDLKFRDLRLPLLYLAMLVVPWWGARARDPLDRRRSALLLAMLVGYLAWLPLFGYYRYLAVLEMLAPIALLFVLHRAWPASMRARIAAAVALLLMFVGTNPSNWDRLPRYGERFVEVEWPAQHRLDGATLVIGSQAPLGYVALALPPNVALIRVESSFYGGSVAPFGIDRQIAQRIDAAPAPLYALLEDRDRPARQLAMGRFGLRIDFATCAPLRSNLSVAHEGTIVLCAVTREASARDALARRR
jgi:hypothetical protein